MTFCTGDLYSTKLRAMALDFTQLIQPQLQSICLSGYVTLGYFRKNQTPPPPPPRRRMARFFDPPSHPDFLDHCDPPSHPDLQGQSDPPGPPGFPLFFTSPKFILQAIENKTHVAFGCFRRYSLIIFNKSFTVTKIVQ